MSKNAHFRPKDLSFLLKKWQKMGEKSDKLDRKMTSLFGRRPRKWPKTCHSCHFLGQFVTFFEMKNDKLLGRKGQKWAKNGLFWAKIGVSSKGFVILSFFLPFLNFY